MSATRTPTILDCTIRDGSYAIDFKFTAEDTALIAGLLDEAGLTYIEVGHGLGLGASEAGMGTAPSNDLEVLTKTRESVGSARLGAFFIPGIGELHHLAEARHAGLDFVRVGQNADEIESTFEYLEFAREQGLEVFLNFMKTYGIPVERFARSCRKAEAFGIAGAYVVDSAGGMMPNEVAAYVRAARESCDVPIGFHGHSNLHLAVANSLAAYEAGATFVDTSVYGIGRSSGNVPTEVMVAVFERLGVATGIDPMQIVDLAETWLRPLAEHLHPHDMVAVSLGYGRFHSSYLPRALDAARKAGINPFRLIAELGKRDVMNLSDELLAATVEELRDQSRPEVRLDVARFSQEGFESRRIGNRPGAVSQLIDGLEVVAAKRHLAVVLDLAASPALAEEGVAAEFVLEDDSMALGRVRFGSAEALAEALADQHDRVEIAILDTDRIGPGLIAEAVAAIEPLTREGVLPYRRSALELDWLGEVTVAELAGAGRSFALADPGTYSAADVAVLVRRLEMIGPVRRWDEAAGAVDVLVIAGTVDAAPIGGEPPGLIVGFTPALGEGPADECEVLELDPHDALRDRVGAWRRALTARDPNLRAARARR